MTKKMTNKTYNLQVTLKHEDGPQISEDAEDAIIDAIREHVENENLWVDDTEFSVTVDLVS